MATNQIINHLDKWQKMHGGNPKVIIKVVVGSTYPLHPGAQHCGNYTSAFKLMCSNIEVIELLKAHEILPAYKRALKIDRSTILVEHGDMYASETV